MAVIKPIRIPAEKQIPASEVSAFLEKIQATRNLPVIDALQIERIAATLQERGSLSAIDAEWLFWVFVDGRRGLEAEALETIPGRVVDEYATRGLEYFVRIAPSERSRERLLTLFTLLSQDLVTTLRAWGLAPEEEEDKIDIMFRLVAELRKGGFAVPGAP